MLREYVTSNRTRRLGYEHVVDAISAPTQSRRYGHALGPSEATSRRMRHAGFAAVGELSTYDVGRDPTDHGRRRPIGPRAPGACRANHAVAHYACVYIVAQTAYTVNVRWPPVRFMALRRQPSAPANVTRGDDSYTYTSGPLIGTPPSMKKPPPRTRLPAVQC